MILLISTSSILLSACNLGLKNIPYCSQLLKRTVGLPLKDGEKIIPVETKEYTDLPLFQGDNRYTVNPNTTLKIRNSIGGLYDEFNSFQIFDNLAMELLLGDIPIPDNPFITHYLVDGEFYNTEIRASVKTSLYVPIEVIHERFDILNP